MFAVSCFNCFSFCCNALTSNDIYLSLTVQSYTRQLIILINRTGVLNADCSVKNMSSAMTAYNVSQKKVIMLSLRSEFRVVMSIFGSSVHPVVCRRTLFFLHYLCLFGNSGVQNIYE